MDVTTLTRMLSAGRALSTRFSDWVDRLESPQCYLCGLSRDECRRLCSFCRSSLPPLPSACPRCGERHNGDGACLYCQQNLPPWKHCFAAFEYRFPLPRLLHELKFSGRTEWAPALAEAAWEHIGGKLPLSDAVLVPVPLHPRRLRQRGFNQAALLAREFSRLSGLPVEENALQRFRHTAPQRLLDRRQRQKNLASAFRRLDVALPARVILVDDVITTGATAAALAEHLGESGGMQVDVLCVARVQTSVGSSV